MAPSEEGKGLGAGAQGDGEQQLLHCSRPHSLHCQQQGVLLAAGVMSWQGSCRSSNQLLLLQRPLAQPIAEPSLSRRADRKWQPKPPVTDAATPAQPNKHAKTLPFARIIAFRFKGYFSAPSQGRSH